MGLGSLFILSYKPEAKHTINPIPQLQIMGMTVDGIDVMKQLVPVVQVLILKLGWMPSEERVHSTSASQMCNKDHTLAFVWGRMSNQIGEEILSFPKNS